MLRVVLVVIGLAVITLVALSVPLRSAHDDRPTDDRVFTTLFADGRIEASYGPTRSTQSVFDLEAGRLTGPTTEAIEDLLVRWRTELEPIAGAHNHSGWASDLVVELRAEDTVPWAWTSWLLAMAAHPRLNVFRFEFGVLNGGALVPIDLPRRDGPQPMTGDPLPDRIPVRVFGTRGGVLGPTRVVIGTPQVDRFDDLPVAGEQPDRTTAMELTLPIGGGDRRSVLAQLAAHLRGESDRPRPHGLELEIVTPVPSTRIVPYRDVLDVVRMVRATGVPYVWEGPTHAVAPTADLRVR